MYTKQMKLLSGSSCPALSRKLADQLGIEMVAAELSEFANGERRVLIQDGDLVRGQNIVLVQSFSDPVDQHIMEFLLLTDALERLGARHINLVIPWMGYSLQDKVFRQGEPIGAKVVANLVSNSYIKRAFLLDLHNTSIPGFFSIPTHHLSALSNFAQYARDSIDLSQAVVASPDFGGLKRARVFANNLELDLVNVDKHRDLKTGQVTAQGLHGDVDGKIVLLFDDCILSGSTVVESAQLIKDQGAAEVHFFATHGIFTNNALQKLAESAVDKLIITNSIQQPEKIDNLFIQDVSHLFADALKNWL